MTCHSEHNVTATEVRMRIDEWERVNHPRWEEYLGRLYHEIFGKWWDLVLAYMRDEEMQQQRMSDDGCPL